MSSGQQGGNSQQPSQTWTEPPWCGFIETTGDALLILEAARRGLIPRVTRRLVDSERKMITSGSVFVFDEDESGIKRWTDGFSGVLAADGSLSRPKNETASIVLDNLTNSPKFKSDGLMKKTFSLTIAGVAQHLISYYKIEDVENGRLRTPSSLPELASLEISPEYLDKTHFRNAPKVEIGADGVPRYRAPIRMRPLYLLTDGHVEPSTSSNKRATPKRFLPYNAGTASRTRKRSKSQADAPGPITLSHSNSSSNSVALSPQTTPPTYASDGSTPSLLISSPAVPLYQLSAPPAVSPPIDSEAAQSPQSQGTASPDHHPQAAPPPQPYHYTYYAPPAASAPPHHVSTQPYPPYPATSSAAWGYGNYAAPPPPAPGAYQHQPHINLQPTMPHPNVPQRDRENSSAPSFPSDPCLFLSF
ncbi:Gti1/Pac2 family-domain-containing protein [Coprinopsis sp. MPI-PUGE-AT-0042]|nr:Gti1/Pac2 family-domain-containing protein [Coprinopsis sp. MPI-PUGE-AT-0042]